jgi:hypothetical protein
MDNVACSSHTGAVRPAPRPLDDLVAETQRLLPHFHELDAPGLHRLATNLALLADRLDAMQAHAERVEGETCDPV